MPSHSSSRRDLVVILCCSVILLFLLDFRYDVTTKVLVKVEQAAPATVRTPLTDLDALDEYGEEPAAATAAAAAATHGSAALKHKTHYGAKHHGKHGHSGMRAAQKHIFDTHDRPVDDTRITWYNREDDMPLTSLVRHSPGWTIMDNVYFLNGTLYIVRADTKPAAFPDLRMMISNYAAGSASGRSGWSGEKRSNDDPTEHTMKLINAKDAEKLFGKHASRVEGTSFISYDDVQLFSHYYHFSAEVLFGLWRTYSSLDLSISPSGHTKLAQPRRFLAPQVPVTRWRDYANLNQYIMRAAFPSTGLEFQGDWEDRAETNRPYVFDRIVLGDRRAASRGRDSEGVGKASFHADKMPKSKHWWAPVRNNVVAFSGGSGGTVEVRPVITYVARQQWGKRMLREADHVRLVQKLKELESRFGWEVNVVNLEEMPRDEQIRLAGRTTILLGVHGAGLTSLVWMRPTDRSTVFEFLAPESFNQDFEYAARMLDIKHFSVWNDKFMSYPDLPTKSKRSDVDMDSNEIPVDADKVASMIVDRLVNNQY